MSLTLISEEDVRSKVVIPWLTSAGFSFADLSIEFGFRIRLGHSILSVSNGVVSPQKRKSNPRKAAQTLFLPRADILVRNSAGQNLLIIEVKGPAEPLDEAARDQGISYARSLIEGNIAPYVVLTNGSNTQVFDSYTRAKITNETEELALRCSERLRFAVGPEEIQLRAEALESLISFSADNLLAFCEGQVEFRMSRLSSEDIHSDKKFIPTLYVERPAAEARLKYLLDETKQRVVLLFGHPQVGKTNFVCNTVRQRLLAGEPCLFFPAISLDGSLLGAISEDFEWTFGGSTEGFGQLVRKIVTILRRAKTHLTIFIDGWNETNLRLAQTIDAECSRLVSEHVRIVISLTHSAALRLLKAPSNIPTFLAEESGVGLAGAGLIEMDPEAAARTQGWSCVFVGRLSRQEQDEAYRKYASAFNVKVLGDHQRSQDPYVIGTAMRQFQNNTLPRRLDEPSLLLNLIKKKAERAIGLDELNVPYCLQELARLLVENGSPIRVNVLTRAWGMPASQRIPVGFFDAALLADETDQAGFSAVDFYYGRERDYAIACMAGNWPLLRSKSAISDSLSAAVCTLPGKDAVRWFLRQPSHLKLLRKVCNGIPTFSDPTLRQIFFAALCDLTAEQDEFDEELARFGVSAMQSDSDRLVKIEAAKLTALIADDFEEVVSVLEKGTSAEAFVESLLLIGEEFPLRAESVGQVVLDVLDEWNSQLGYEDTEIIHILKRLCDHHHDHIRREANTAFAHISPFDYVEFLAAKISKGGRHKANNLDEFVEAVQHSQRGLQDAYYGHMCRGIMEGILDDPEVQAEEYAKMAAVLPVIIAKFGSVTSTQIFQNILDDLQAGLDEVQSQTDMPPSLGSRHVDTHTLPLPFPDE